MGGQGRDPGGCRVLVRALLLGGFALAAAPAAAHAGIYVDNARAAEGSGSITFTITREAGLLAGPVTVSYRTADGSAKAQADYAPASGTRRFPGALTPTTQSEHVTVSLARDGLDEADETVRLLVDGHEVADGEATGTIADDDAAATIGVLDATPAAEGTTAAFQIGLNKPSGRDVSVTFATVDGSAVAGQDYTPRSGRITIPAGSTSAGVGVSLLDDGAHEPDERFELRLSAPSAASLGDGAGIAAIVDDDAPARPGGSSPPRPPDGSGSGNNSGDGNNSGSGQPQTGSGSRGLPQLGVSSPRLRQPSTVLVTISCPTQSGRCDGRLTVFSRPSKRSRIKALRKERRLGRQSFTLAGGDSRTLRIALSRRDRALLRRAGRMRVRLYVVTTDSAGQRGVRRVNGTLVARTRHSG
jgi:Calx-beta domain-containing protein